MDYQFDWTVIWQYRGLLLNGLCYTIILSAISLVVSFVLGTLVALGRLFLSAWCAWLCAAATELFRNIPPIVQFFFWYFAVGLDGLTACVVGLSAFTAARVAEIVRSGLMSIPKTQFEAARASGLGMAATLCWILLPQAFIRVIPVLAGEVVNIVKDSSIAMTLGYAELSFQAQEIEANTFRGFESATAATLIYAALGMLVLLTVHGIERRLRRDVRIG
ncbi:amino acid ABC transporter permease [Affinibrenneria salicis]|uniref:amino acid ABC transporter permease n=1 Tax=Affinibrenneria salicis TaxID=2590031 RepID=UPI00168B02A0|nr:amino acid ABC transporter permease [Affinibrenneria salicis]